ncbi:DUF6527 family protein [Pantoea agglomerans]|nr:DUF6527 family protein [Pantoea agglomerans]WIL43067.1 DUF6527 family protein [Pantoea agglomerans]
MTVSNLKLMEVDYMPVELEEGILYYSDKYGTAAHLCACGCRQKIRTPIGPTEWKLTKTIDGPSLSPSVGNWQKECRSHYIIHKGCIEWCGHWTDEQVDSGRKREIEIREEYYRVMYQNRSWYKKAWFWIKGKLGF